MTLRCSATLAVALAAAAAGCQKRQTFGTEIKEPQHEAFGHPVAVTTEDSIYFGELVACSDTRVFLLLEGRGMYVLWQGVQKIAVRRESAGEVAGLSTWAAVGATATLSHGFLSPVTGSVWLAIATPSIVLGVQHPYMSGTCREIRAYARYPQGLPASMAPLFARPGEDPKALLEGSVAFAGAGSRSTIPTHDPAELQRAAEAGAEETWIRWRTIHPTDTCAAALAQLRSADDCVGRACETSIVLASGYIKNCHPDTETRIDVHFLVRNWKKQIAADGPQD